MQIKREEIFWNFLLNPLSDTIPIELDEIILHLGSNEFGTHLNGAVGLLLKIGGFVVLIGSLNGGRYVAGCAVGVGFGQRGSSDNPRPHCNGLKLRLCEQRGSKEPTT